MSGKYLIFGATGSIGSNLSRMMAENDEDVQLIGRDDENLKRISSETGFKYNVVDVLEPTKIESLKSELIDYGVFVGINYPGFTENEEHKTIINSEGVEVRLSKRPGINALTREQTAGKIIEQLQKKKFRMYSSISAKIIQIIYNLLPNLTLRIVIYLRKKIISMQ